MMKIFSNRLMCHLRLVKNIFGGNFQKQEGVIVELKGKLSSAEKEKEAYRIQKEEVLKDKQQVKHSLCGSKEN